MRKTACGPSTCSDASRYFEAEGTVIEIRPGSGVIMRCPDCNRTIQNNECINHGKVEGKLDLRIKLVIDDGTGSVSSILNREIAETLIGKTLDESKKMDESELLDLINKVLFANRITIQGNAFGDEFGTSIIAKEAKLVKSDVKKEAEKLSQELGELL